MTALLVFLACAAIIAFAGSMLSAKADILADRTGLGEAFMGAVFLGAATSLPGITASVTAAVDHHPTLALSNAIGGIAVQTAFLAVADLSYRDANLEHAAASASNLMFGVLLILMLSVLLWATLEPQVAWAGVHAATPILLAVYLFGVRLVYRSHEHPMWRPRITRETRMDTPDPPNQRQPLARSWTVFGALALVIVCAGAVLTRAAEQMMELFGISETVTGAFLVAVSTSLPELVTSIAAIRQGALTLAVGGVLGGNAFDTLFAAMADIAYRPGPIYAAAGSGEQLLIVLTIIMSAVLLLGLLTREKRGLANIGFEGAVVLLLYATGFLALTVW